METEKYPGIHQQQCLPLYKPRERDVGIKPHAAQGSRGRWASWVCGSAGLPASPLGILIPEHHKSDFTASAPEQDKHTQPKVRRLSSWPRPFQPSCRQAARPPRHGSQGAASPAGAALLTSGHQPTALPSAAPLTMSCWGPCNLTDGRSAGAGQCPSTTPATFWQTSGATKANTPLPQAALRQAPGWALRRVVPDRSSSPEGPAHPSCAHEG